MEPLFKIGQKVTIKDIGNDHDDDYPFGFVSGMQKLKNKAFEITDIHLSHHKFLSSPYYDKFDGYCYYIKQSRYSWSSPMFQETYEL